MIKFLKKLFGIGEEPVIELPVVEPVTEVEKTIAVEKLPVKGRIPKKETVVRTTKKREKPVLKAIKAEAPPVKKRGRPAKKK